MTETQTTETQTTKTRRGARRGAGSYIVTIIIGILSLLAYFWVTETIPAPKSEAPQARAQYRQWDLEVTSSLLIGEDDVMAIRSLTGVSYAEAVYRADAALVLDGESDAVSVMSMTQDINPPVILEGRLPEMVGECAVVQELQGKHTLAVGQRIRLESTAETDADPLPEKEYVITGIFRYPLRSNFLDAGNPDVLVREACFDRDGLDGGDMRVYVCAAGTIGSRADAAYWSAVEPAESQIRELAARREALRVAKLRSSRRAESAVETAMPAATPTPLPATAAPTATPEPVVETPEPTATPAPTPEAVKRTETPEYLEKQRQLEAAAEKLAAARQTLDERWTELEQTETALNAARDALNQNGSALDEAELAIAGLYAGDEELRLYREGRTAWFISGEEYLDALALHEQNRKKLEQAEEDYAAELAAYEEDLRSLKALAEMPPDVPETVEPTPEPVAETPEAAPEETPAAEEIAETIAEMPAPTPEATEPPELMEDYTWRLRRNPSTEDVSAVEETATPEETESGGLSALRLPLQMLFLAITALAVWFLGAKILSAIAGRLARPKPSKEPTKEDEKAEPKAEPDNEAIAPENVPETASEATSETAPEIIPEPASETTPEDDESEDDEDDEYEDDEDDEYEDDEDDEYEDDEDDEYEDDEDDESEDDEDDEYEDDEDDEYEDDEDDEYEDDEDDEYEDDEDDEYEDDEDDEDDEYEDDEDDESEDDEDRRN